jgi:hypothetical protein
MGRVIFGLPMTILSDIRILFDVAGEDGIHV